MKKEWFIKIGGEQQGPFNIQDLKLHPGVTPYTLVKKRGWNEWVVISEVRELDEVFEDNKCADDPCEASKKFTDVLAISSDPKNFITILIIVLLVILYMIWK